MAKKLFEFMREAEPPGTPFYVTAKRAISKWGKLFKGVGGGINTKIELGRIKLKSKSNSSESVEMSGI